MKPDIFLQTIVDPHLSWLEKTAGIKRTDEARLEVLCIAGQESNWSARRQVGLGQYHPQKVGARGYWQFESTWGGPVALNDVMQKASQALNTVCKALEIPNDELSLYEACAWNDALACSLARLLLWIDAAPLPQIGDELGGWNYYQRNWKPGAPHRETWARIYPLCVNLIRGGQA